MPTLMELADEFHLTTVEALEICDKLGIDAEGLGSELDDGDTRRFRDGAKAGIHKVDEDEADDAPAPSLAKQLGVSAAAPSTQPQPPPQALGAGAPEPLPAFGGLAPSAAPAAPKPPKVPLRDRLPEPIADNLVVVIVGVVVLVGLSALVISSSLSSSGPKDPEELGMEAASALNINDCIDLPEGSEAGDIPELGAVPSGRCAEPHDVELYAEVRTYQGQIMEKRGDYPGVDEILADGLSECIGRYEKFVGSPYRSSEYDVIVIAPTGETWTDPSERVSMCGVSSRDGTPLEGSVKNRG